MEKKDHLIKDSFVLFVATTVVNISNFVFHMYVTRKLGPEGYGALATVLAMLVIVSMPSLALQMTITKKTSMFKANGKYGSIENLFKKATKWALMLGLAYFVLFVVGAGWIQSFFNIEDKMLIYILGLIAIVSLLTPVVRGVLQGLQNFIGFGFNLAIDAILRLTFVVLFIWLGWGVRGALSTTLFSPMCAFVIGVLMMSFIFKYKEEDVEVISKRDLFSYAMPIFFSMVGFSILSYMDLLMVKHFYSQEQAGFYAVTSIIGKAILFFPMAIIMTLFPKVSEQHELNNNTTKMLLKSLGLTAIVALAGIMFCFIFPKIVIGLLAGDKYFEIAGVVRLFGFAILPLVLFNVIVNYSLAVHKYAFIYIMYAGIILYAILLWFFHNSFYQVLGVLFIVSFLILIASVASLIVSAKRSKDGV